MENLNKLKSLMEELSVNTIKVFTKNNKSAGIRARKSLLAIEQMILPFRKEILNKMKEIPVKKKKDDE